MGRNKGRNNPDKSQNGLRKTQNDLTVRLRIVRPFLILGEFGFVVVQYGITVSKDLTII
mgnify:CR=1 FL=1